MKPRIARTRQSKKVLDPLFRKRNKARGERLGKDARNPEMLEILARRRRQQKKAGFKIR